MEYMDWTVERFFEFAQHHDTSRSFDEYTHLQGYLIAWLENSDAIEWTGRNYETWLRTALHVADAVFKDPSLLDYRPVMDADEDAEGRSREPEERRIEGLINRDQSESFVYDRHFYESILEQHKRQPDPFGTDS